MSHVRFAREPDDIKAARTPPASADVVIACDLVVAGSGDALVLFDKGRTEVVANHDVTPTKEFIEDRNVRFDADLLASRVRARARGFASVNAEALAERHFGDAIYANFIMVGMTWQRGLLPVSELALYRAIKLNGVKVQENMAAFDLGRLAAVGGPEAIAPLKRPEPPPVTLDALIDRRAALLADYQDAAYAETYRAAVARVRTAESALGLGEALTRAAATFAAKLMAYKDEYEVARLYADPAYAASIRETFGEGARLTFHLAPPLLSKKNHRGELIKRPFGAWMLPAFRLLRRMKGLRRTRFDPFGWTAERQMERRLRDEYLARLDRLAAELTPARHALAVEIASVPDDIRGFGHVKERSVEVAEARLATLMARWSGAPAPASSPAPAPMAAE
jgi:indolepyruvate ferredoxin oxidoreductase